ncbi:response regulator [Tropicimonas sp. IMCC34011]|uniref:response regulator n=1 Tax=Tropicimonas sp. IMCC34011 TaxID=2248759 RepID=UPI000E221D85|nr:response regulator [Tropicimonas sp. IMCC34011]
MAGEHGSYFPNEEPAVLKVLIVEDNAFIALDLEAQILEMGHVVVGIAATASKAVEMSRKTFPDLALVDLKLADGSRGQDAALVLRNEMRVPSVIVSGSLHEMTEAEAALIRPLAMLSKPLLPNELRRVLESNRIASSAV